MAAVFYLMMIRLFFDIPLSHLNRIGLHQLRVNGISKQAPAKSDKKPGSISNRPPMKMHRPSAIASPAFCHIEDHAEPYNILRFLVFFAAAAPIMPVRIIKRTVGKMPISLPENRNMPISIAGNRIKSKNKNLISKPPHV